MYINMYVCIFCIVFSTFYYTLLSITLRIAFERKAPTIIQYTYSFFRLTWEN